MKLFVDTSLENPWGVEKWALAAKTWRDCTVVADAAQADAIVVTLADPRQPYDARIEELSQSQTWRRAKSRVFVFDSQDAPLGLFPGVYSSLRRSLFSPARHRTGPYLQSFNPYLKAHPTSEQPRWLMSFQGNVTAPLRARILGHDFGRPDVLLEQVPPLWSRLEDPATRAAFERYATVIGDSRFVLCPKGNGTSSFRLFETMQSARVPVIISDAWVPTSSVPWDTFSIRVAESDIARLAEICEAHEPRWREMAETARRVWLEHFSPEALGRFLSESIRHIGERRRLPESFYAAGWPLRRGIAGSRRALVRGKIALSNILR